jgi:PleD family two-component response regulator
VARASFEWQGRRIPVTISLGSASTEDPDIDAEGALVAAADRALLTAKQAGRDRSLICRGGKVS